MGVVVPAVVAVVLAVVYVYCCDGACNAGSVGDAFRTGALVAWAGEAAFFAIMQQE